LALDYNFYMVLQAQEIHLKISNPNYFDVAAKHGEKNCTIRMNDKNTACILIKSVCMEYSIFILK